MTLSDEIAWTGAAELASRIRRRELSPVELVDACIARIEARNPSLNALVFYGFEDARKAARQAEQAVMAGAHVEEVEVGIARPQRELSDLWCRLITPGSIHAFEMFKAGGIDLLRDHRDDLPPQFLEWFERGLRYSALDLLRDQALRSEIYHAIQGVLTEHHLLVTPTLACAAALNADDGDTVGPSSIEGEAVDPLIGWCLTYPINFTGHPAASLPAGLADGLPVGMQIVGRRYADADVLAASAAFERLRPWQQTYEVCAGRPL